MIKRNLCLLKQKPDFFFLNSKNAVFKKMFVNVGAHMYSHRALLYNLFY